uniref:Uncharacterized protein n=1 Tax=viral metagenome TaxID=1070528 RepID=A0A6M3X7I0_9ZZZZ
MKPLPLKKRCCGCLIDGRVCMETEDHFHPFGVPPVWFYKREDVKAATEFLINKIIEDWPLRCDTLTEKNVRVDNGIFDFVQSKIKEAFPDVLEEEIKTTCLCGKELGKPCLCCGNSFEEHKTPSIREKPIQMGEFNEDDKTKLLSRLDSLYTRATAEKISIERISGAGRRYDELLEELDKIRKEVRGEES